MIFVDRANHIAPAALTKKKSLARKETAEAIWFFRAIANANGSFTFDKYKTPGVKKQLKKLFNGKCAYCEARLVTVSVGDIEHFRPKSEITHLGGTIRPGYYWLAATWDNLLLSCSNCNRNNTFEIVGGGEIVAGKMAQFPITHEDFRMKNPNGDFDVEEIARYLIDPCKDEPERYLYFEDDGLIKAKQIDGVESTKGLHTIDICALQRKDLVEDREMLVSRIKSQMQTINNFLFLQNREGGVGIDEDIDSMLAEEVVNLKAFLDSREPFLAVARQYIQPFLVKIGIVD